MRREHHGIFATRVLASLLVVIVLAAMARSQSVVIPSFAASVEASSFSGFPFTAQHGRHQLLVDSAHLVGLGSPWSISEIWFRRDMTHQTQGQPSRMLGGSVDMEVWAGAAPNKARSPSEVFQANRGTGLRRVFRGTITLPDVGSSPATPAPWAVPDAVRVGFGQPVFGIASDDLVLEIVMTPTPGQPAPKFWIVDEEWYSAPGLAVTFGQSCSPRSPFMEAGAEDENLRPGGSAFFTLWAAAPNSPCLHLIGISDRYFLGAPILPLELTPYQAPGCSLYTDMVIVSPKVTMARTGAANTILFLPPDPALVGATLFSQWIVSEPGANALGATTSNGVKVLLLSGPSTSGVTIVRHWDLNSPTGLVQTHVCPVMRLVR